MVFRITKLSAEYRHIEASNTFQSHLFPKCKMSKEYLENCVRTYVLGDDLSRGEVMKGESSSKKDQSNPYKLVICAVIFSLVSKLLVEANNNTISSNHTLLNQPISIVQKTLEAPLSCIHFHKMGNWWQASTLETFYNKVIVKEGFGNENSVHQWKQSNKVLLAKIGRLSKNLFLQ